MRISLLTRAAAAAIVLAAPSSPTRADLVPFTDVQLTGQGIGSTLTVLTLQNGSPTTESGGVLFNGTPFGKGSLTVADGHLIVMSDTGTLALVAADPAGYREEARFQHSEQPSSWTEPVLAGGRLYVRDKTRLVCYDVRKTP